MATEIDAAKCDACKDCVEACPVEAIEIQDDHAMVDQDECTDCGACADVCPNDAITVE